MVLTDEHTNWFLEIESTPSEDDVNIVQVTVQDLEHDIHLVDKAAAAEFERTVCNVERNSTVGKHYVGVKEHLVLQRNHF